MKSWCKPKSPLYQLAVDIGKMARCLGEADHIPASIGFGLLKITSSSMFIKVRNPLGRYST